MSYLRLLVFDALANLKGERLTHFTDIEKMSLSPIGVCLEAELTGYSRELGIAPRDIVLIEIYRDDGAGGFAGTPLYAGYCTRAGNPKSADLQSYRFTGLKQLFYERRVSGERFFGGDLATVIFDLVTGPGNLPASVSVPALSAVGFETGDIEPNQHMLGEVIDQLSQLAPGFDVPASQSYTYNGDPSSPNDPDVYYAGDTVPPLLWGVNRNRQFVLTRGPKARTLALTEGADGVQVEWPEVNAEGVVTRSSVILGRVTEAGRRSETTNAEEPFKQYEYDHPAQAEYGVIDRPPVVVVPEALWLEIVPVSWTLDAANTLEAGSLADLGDQASTNPVAITSSATLAPVDDASGAYVKLTCTIPQDAYVDGFTVQGDEGVDFIWAVKDAGADLGPIKKFDGTKLNGVVFFREQGGPGTHYDMEFWVRTESQETAVNLTDLYPVRVRSELLNELARSYTHVPAPAPAWISKPFADPTTYNRIELTELSGGDPVTLEVKQIELSATTEEGEKTVYRCGQRLDADEEAEAIEVERFSQNVDLKSARQTDQHQIPAYRRPRVIAAANSQAGNTIPPTDETPVPNPGGGGGRGATTQLQAARFDPASAAQRKIKFPYFHLPNFTFEGWFSPQGAGNMRFLSTYTGGGQIAAGDIIFDFVPDTLGGRILVGTGGGQFVIATGHVGDPDGGYRHVAATYDGSALRLYHNAVLVGDRSLPVAPARSAGEYSIGEDTSFSGGTGSENFRGFMDEFRIWNYARSPEQILEKMENSLDGDEAGLELYLPFEGSTIQDVSPAQRTLTFQNPSLITLVSDPLPWNFP